VSPAEKDRGESGEPGELLPAAQPTGEERPSRQPEGTYRAGTPGREGRDVGTGRGHGRGQGSHKDGGVRATIAAVSNQAATDRRGRA